MNRFVLLLLGALTLLATVGALSANAGGDYNPPDKVFVCKYVGKPGVDETLQTGQNPISVSINSIQDFPGVGGSFADAQGRSLVIAFDTGQEEEPSCPDGQGCEEDCTPPTDYCPTLPGVQAEDEDCPPPPPVDVCPNLQGDQDQIPDGFMLVDGQCVLIPPPPPPPPHIVVGAAGVYCDTGAKLYRTVGTIDGQEADTVNPATIPGNVKGVTNVVVTRGDTSYFTTVTPLGDCNPTLPTVVVTVAAVTVTPPAVVPPAAKPVVKPKPKPPVRKPAAKPKPKHKAPKPAPPKHKAPQAPPHTLGIT